MRAFVLIALVSACYAGRVALLFSNRTVARAIGGGAIGRGILPSGSPRRQLFPRREGDDGQYWTSKNLMNCSHVRNSSKIICHPISSDQATLGLLEDSLEIDRYVLLVYENATDWKDWNVPTDMDVLQSVTVAIPDIGKWTGWQSLTMHAFVSSNNGSVGMYVRQNQLVSTGHLLTG